MNMSRWVLFTALLFFAVSAASGQEHCADVKQGPSEAALEARVKTLQRELASTQAVASESRNARSMQEQLLIATEELECRQEDSVSVQKGILTKAAFVRVPLFYVTDRQRSASQSHGGEFYTSVASDGLEFGRVSATINEVGGVRTSLIKGTKRVPRPASMGSAQVEGLEPLSEASFLDTLSASGTDDRRQPVHVVLFVHGFDVQFYEAALHLARLATSMEIPVVPVFYSWPSQGDVVGYWHDEDEVSAAVVRITPFLEKLLSQPGGEITIVCHSMGARIVTRSLGELARNKVPLPSLSKVAFAAADINVEEFNAQWPYLKQMQGVEWTFYESSGDFALRLSKIVHTFRRLGESDGAVYIEDGTDTVDASSTTSILRTLGHSYITSSPALAGDIGDWVAQDLPPAIRGLQRMEQGDAVYWRFP